MPWRGAFNEYPQQMFSLRNKKKYQYFLVEKCALSRAMVPYLLYLKVSEEIYIYVGLCFKFSSSSSSFYLQFL